MGEIFRPRGFRPGANRPGHDLPARMIDMAHLPILRARDLSQTPLGASGRHSILSIGDVTATIVLMQTHAEASRQ